jgi:hypothetical protein
MERSNIYVLTLSFLLYSTAIFLLILGEDKFLNVYIGFFALEFFTTTLIYSPGGQSFQIISVTLFFGWMITAALAVAGFGF